MKKSLAFLSAAMIMLSSTACEDSGPIPESETTTVFETEPVTEDTTENEEEYSLPDDEDEQDDDPISIFNKYNCKINTVVINANTADVYYNTPTFSDIHLDIYDESGKKYYSTVEAADPSTEKMTIAINAAELPGHYTVDAYITESFENEPICETFENTKHSGTVKLDNFTSDRCYFNEGEKNSIIFTASVQGMPVEHNVYNENDEVIGTMKDDGEGADKFADDGIYTLQYDPVFPESGKMKYYANIDGQKSAVLDTFNFDAPTKDEMAEFDECCKKISSIDSEYSDADGFIESDKVGDAVKAVGKYAEELYDDGTLIRYSISDESVYFKFACGMPLVYQPKIEGVLAGGDELEIYTFRLASNTEHGNFDALNVASTLGTLVSSKFDYINYDGVLHSGQEVSPEYLIDLFGPNQVIIWLGHGGFINTLDDIQGNERNMLCLEYSPNDIAAYIDQVRPTGDPVSFDFADDSLAWGTNNNIWITSTFIDKYIGDMSNSFVWLGGCDTMFYDQLSNAFIDKHAECVAGSSYIITAEYLADMTRTTFETMTQRKRSGELYTAQESLKKAKSKHGKTNSWNPFSEYTNTKLIMVGDYSFDRRFLLNGFVTDSISGRPISGAAVTIKYDELGVDDVTAVTDSNGKYSVYLQCGGYTVEVTAEGLKEKIKTHTIKGEPNQTINLKTKFEPYKITANAVDQHGNPINNAHFALDKEAKEYYGMFGSSTKIFGVKKGTYTVNASVYDFGNVLIGSGSEKVNINMEDADINIVIELPEKKKNRYEIIDMGMSWSDAERYCESKGGHLAVITSEEEQTEIEELLKKGKKNSYWIGATKTVSGWFWVTGESFAYSKWGWGQPDNHNGNENGLMIYTATNPLNSRGSGFGIWNDLKTDCTCGNEEFFGTSNFGFICEWES